MRRCGKSTLIQQRFLEKDQAIYANFEDLRLIDFELDDFLRIEELMKEMGKTYFVG